MCLQHLLRWIFYLVVAGASIVATPFLHTPSAPARDLQPAIEAGVAFLKSQYNAELGLLQESPDIGQHNYYLTNDNALATYTLETLGVESELAAALRASLKRYGYDDNGFINVAWGQQIRWPPYHHKDIVVAQTGQDRILQETHTGPGYFYDWSAYSNLAFMAALNEYNQNYQESARRLYKIEMSTFDGLGWHDKAYWDRDGVYETIGPAWALYVGATIGAPPNRQNLQILQVLLDQQDPITGGFHTHYRPGAPRLADPNIETTSLALLALHAWQEK